MIFLIEFLKPSHAICTWNIAALPLYLTLRKIILSAALDSFDISINIKPTCAPLWCYIINLSRYLQCPHHCVNRARMLTLPTQKTL